MSHRGIEKHLTTCGARPKRCSTRAKRGVIEYIGQDNRVASLLRRRTQPNECPNCYQRDECGYNKNSARTRDP